MQGAKRAISNLLYGSSVCTDDKYSLNSSWPIVSYTSTNHMVSFTCIFIFMKGDIFKYCTLFQTNKDMLYGQIIFEVLEYGMYHYEKST